MIKKEFMIFSFTDCQGQGPICRGRRLGEGPHPPLLWWVQAWGWWMPVSEMILSFLCSCEFSIPFFLGLQGIVICQLCYTCQLPVCSLSVQWVIKKIFCMFSIILMWMYKSTRHGINLVYVEYYLMWISVMKILF